MKIGLTLTGTAGFGPEIVDAALREAIPRITRLVEVQARRNLGGGLVRVRTGETVAGLSSRLRLGGTKPSGEVGEFGRRGFIARLLESGVKPHKIRGKRGGLLTFRAGGRAIRAHTVNHPGFPGRHWLRAAVETVTPQAEKELQASLDRAIAAASRQAPTSGFGGPNGNG